MADIKSGDDHDGSLLLRGETPIAKILARPRPGREYGETPIPKITPPPPMKPKK